MANTQDSPHNYTEEESRILERSFELMEREDVPYLVLRGYTFLPLGCVSDIDILVDAASFDKAVRLLESLGFARPRELPEVPAGQIPGRNYPGMLASAIRHPFGAVRWLAGQLTKPRLEAAQAPDPPTVSIDADRATYVSLAYHNVRIDAWKHLGYRSLMLEALYRADPEIEREMLATRRLFNNLCYVASPPHEIAHLVARIVLDKEGGVPEHYERTISRLVDDLKVNPEYVQTLQNDLTRLFYKADGLVMRKILDGELGTIRDSLLQFQDY